ncbi:TIGR03086 family protein [Acrocarpospora phusangensis]|uniref:TIGR03086 family protein n=1 Tax=Acrocarpospora phusangensis TaxID=1070424 RepID=A0A919QJ43_9ACTN|nr:TIGR03086 family metal-binding protein [Acrocarpospora phusangensis]GIH28989.1 TIGR03086 family protein [Acrocarpospora phusangensis]
MDTLELHERAMREFADRVHAVGEDQWRGSTPCSAWDVRMLVNHMVAENLWTAPMMAGRTIADVGSAFEGDLLGADPVKAFETSAEQAVLAVHEPGALDRTVHLSYGDASGSEYAKQLSADLLIHSWDLARATGGDEQLDPELVATCASWFAGEEDAYRAAGMIAPKVDVPADADPQTRLLAAFGRAA